MENEQARAEQLAQMMRGEQEKQLDHQMQGEMLVLCVRGEIDHHSAAYLRAQADRLIFSLRPHLVRLGVSWVSFMDSAGLGLILGRMRSAKEAGAAFCLYHPTQRIVTLLQMAGMDKHIQIEYAPKTTQQSVS